jgi:hypothetical protein
LYRVLIDNNILIILEASRLLSYSKVQQKRFKNKKISKLLGLL